MMKLRNRQSQAHTMNPSSKGKTNTYNSTATKKLMAELANFLSKKVATVILIISYSYRYSISITSLGEERANLSAFRTFVRFVLVWICRFPLPLGVWEVCGL